MKSQKYNNNGIFYLNKPSQTKIKNKTIFLDYLTDRLSRNVGNYKSTLRNVSEKRRPH
jgi:hypothetical protein